MNFTKKDAFYGIIILIILICSMFYIQQTIKHMDDKFKQYDNSISAINDTIKKTVHDNFVTYSKLSPEIDIKTLVNSEFFKTLSADQKSFYKELLKIKGLISATQIELHKHGEAIASFNAGQVHGDTISYKYGTVLKFSETDTSKKFKYTADVILNKPADFKLKYDYDFKIKSTFARQKDKSIVVNYELDDKDLEINKMYNFTIPVSEKKTKLGKWLEKNRKSLLVTAGGLIFAGGTYTGIKLSNTQFSIIK